MNLTLTLTNELALELKNLKKGIVANKIEFQFDVSTFKRNGQTVVNQVTVDGFENGDWNEELTNVYHIGEEINSEKDLWINNALREILK